MFLSVTGITKRFGGIAANRDISFDVAAGELVGIIGPNGSGKSTLFEVITGFYRPDAGEVRLDSHRLTGLTPDRVCRLGVARTFQKLRPFPVLTALDNVMVGALTRLRDVGQARARDLLERVASPTRQTRTRARCRPASASGSSWRERSPRSRGSSSSMR
jgi:branched-chain amino acid transport system ATP-binding protein